MKNLFGAIFGNAVVLSVVIGVPLLALVFLPYEYGMPLILIWLGGLVLLWVVSVVRAMLRRDRPGTGDWDAP